jgi:DNA invertase Pin-like site-specific DNA recombinase
MFVIRRPGGIEVGGFMAEKSAYSDYPSHYDLKGTMSEAEIHVMRARLRGGILNKARRGELHTILPVGFVYDPDGRIVLDPDKQVQAAIRLLFQTFLRTGGNSGHPQSARPPNRRRKTFHHDKPALGATCQGN